MTGSKRLFNDTVLELKARIESYKENGFEYSSLENSLNDIIKRCESDTKIVKNEPFMAEEKSKNYSKYYSELLDLVYSNQKEFDNFMFLMFAKYIKSASITIENLDEYVNSAISYLQKCKDNISTNTNIDTIFDSLLDLILMELTIKNNSSLLEYIKCYSEYCYFLNRVASKRTNNLNKKDVKSILNREGATGELFPYIEEDLLKLMAMDSSSPLRKEVLKQVKTLESKLDDKEHEQTHIITKIRKIKGNKKEYRKAVATGILGLSLLAGIAIGWPTSFYKDTHSRYIMDVKRYNVIEGETLVEEDHRYDTLDGKTYIFEYSPWESTNDGFVRSYNKYDVSNIDYEELAEYLLLDLQRLGTNYEKKEEFKDALVPEDLYEDTLYEVVDYDLNHVSYVGPLGDADGSVAWLLCSLVLFAIGSAGMYTILLYLKDRLSIIKMDSETLNGEELGNDIKKLLDKYEAVNKDITKIKDELLALYNKYKFLLDDKKIKCNYRRLER